MIIFIVLFIRSLAWVLLAKIKALAGLFASRGSREESVFLPFAVSRSCPCCLAHGPLSSSSEPAMLHPVPLTSFYSDLLLCLLLLLRTFVIVLGPFA